METVRLTTAQALIKFLDNQYVEFDGKEQKFFHGVLSIFGHGNVLGIGQAMEEAPGDLILYQGRNEQGLGHVATGFTKQNKRKRTMVVTSSVGPGAANMVTAAATATANRIPVLFLPGDTFATRQPDPVLQQVEQFHDHSLTTNDAFRAVSKYWDRVNRPEQLMSAMLDAMKVLTSPSNTGAVTVALPQDVQGEAYDFPASFLKKRIHTIQRTPPTKRMIDEAVQIIKQSKKPMLICGGGVKYAEAEETLKAFAEKLNIPFGETQAGKSAVVSSHPLNVGGIGTTGCLSANLIASNADLVIGIGTRYTDFTTASKWLFKEDARFININIAEFDAPKMDAFPIIADAKATLEQLLLALGDYKSGYTDEIENSKQAWSNELKRLYDCSYKVNGFEPEVTSISNNMLREYAKELNSSLTQTEVLGIVNQQTLKNSIVVGASGSLPGDMQRVWLSEESNSYHMEYGYSCMGYEVAAGLGAKIAQPDKEVYVLLGDGSYQMLHSELVTSIQENKKINLLLLDNMQFGCINNLQRERGMGSIGTEFRKRNPKTGKLDGELLKIDYAKCAEGYGCKTYSVRTREALLAALEDAKKQTVSTLIDIKVLPKTMTHGYEAFWRACGNEVAENKEIVKLTNEQKEQLKRARQY